MDSKNSFRKVRASVSHVDVTQCKDKYLGKSSILYLHLFVLLFYSQQQRCLRLCSQLLEIKAFSLGTLVDDQRLRYCYMWITVLLVTEL